MSITIFKRPKELPNREGEVLKVVSETVAGRKTPNQEKYRWPWKGKHLEGTDVLNLGHKQGRISVTEHCSSRIIPIYGHSSMCESFLGGFKIVF